jgi:diacylglycerol kinase family enzyme
MVTERAKLPAVVIVNPGAGRLSEKKRDHVLGSLRSHFRIDEQATPGRDAAIALARRAAADGAPLVIAFGGDGLVNEVANGLVGTEASLGIVPGGTMNVFARALGVPREPRRAAGHLAAAARRPPRRVTLGKMDERYFTFSAGCGFDAEAAERVESAVSIKRRFGEAYFYWSASRLLAGRYRHCDPFMRVQGHFGDVPVAMAVVSNAGPYAYVLGIPVVLAPRVALDGGLDVFALRKTRLGAMPGYAWKATLAGGLDRHKDAFYASNLESFDVVSHVSFHRHVDGEPLPPAPKARFTLERDVLRVQA